MTGMAGRTQTSNASLQLAFIVPAYNEEAVIGRVINDIRHNPKFTKQMVIIVVNDGSDDQTSRAVRTSRSVILIEHTVNMGAGAATRTGLAAARQLGCRYAVTLDADGQHKISNAFKLVEIAKKQHIDLLIGSRLINKKGMPNTKVFGNVVLNVVSYLLLGIVVSDSQSGLRVFSRKALEKLTYHSNAYAFCSEMIWRAKNVGLVVQESSIDAVYTDYSKRKGQKNVAGFFAITGSLLKHRLTGLLNE